MNFKLNAAYVIGADTKGEGKDFYAASVIDNSTGERAAALKMQCSNSKPFTYQLYCLGTYYGDTHIAVEANFNTAPIEELEILGYANKYARVFYDEYTKKELKKYGFKTDGATRRIISGLCRIMQPECCVMLSERELIFKRYKSPAYLNPLTFSYNFVRNGTRRVLYGSSRPAFCLNNFDDILPLCSSF